jgi:hypothetical protein
MNFQNFYNKVKQIALNTKTIETFYEGDVYINWNSLNVTYGSFDVNINYIRRTGNFNVVNCTFYYGNKLFNDSSNVFQVQSDGYNAIINIINHLREDYEIEDYEDIQVHPFFQQFSDVLAGCYCDLNIYVPIDDICEDFDKEQ